MSVIRYEIDGTEYSFEAIDHLDRNELGDAIDVPGVNTVAEFPF